MTANAAHSYAQTELEFDPKPLLHNSTPTSIAAAESQLSNKKQRDKEAIVAFVKQHGGATRDELVQGLGLGVGTVCPRVFELIRAGVLVEPGEKRETRTGSKAYVLYAKS